MVDSPRDVDDLSIVEFTTDSTFWVSLTERVASSIPVHAININMNKKLVTFSPEMKIDKTFIQWATNYIIFGFSE